LLAPEILQGLDVQLVLLEVVSSAEHILAGDPCLAKGIGLGSGLPAKEIGLDLKFAVGLRLI
jgi:hypothetical protein